MFKFGARSRRNLAECHQHLQDVAPLALARSPFDFGIIDGGRTLQEQIEFKAAGKSWTLKSRHRFARPLTAGGRPRRGPPVSHALDFMIYLNGKACWEFALYERVWLEAWRPAAAELGIPLGWGGKWKSQDGPHIQLPWKQYPAQYTDAPAYHLDLAA